ncbi:MAG: ornithine cyclodeaminase family protein [Micromonosporaceae bacterium]|nr:ornithine cyclodeaminase family protein [Micromonosporaceae bacterium]
MRLLDNADVQSVLDMRGTIAALRRGYDDLRRGEATYVPRIDMFAPTGRPHDYYQWGSMAGVSTAYGVAAVRIKSDVVSWEGGTTEKYCVQPGRYCGLILCFRVSDGAPLALLQDGYLQHMRVGAAAGIGTDALARTDAGILGVLGSGGMAWTYVEAIAQVRRLTEVRVFSPTPQHRTAFAGRVRSELGIEAVAVPEAEQAVRGTGIVATATDSMGPTFDPAWLDPGTHVVCVTRRELGDALLDRADVVLQLGVHTVPYGTEVPMMEWAAGAIASYVSGSPEDRRRIPPGRAPERGAWPTLLDLETGRVPGRRSDTDVTVFVATGTQGLQFAAVAGHVLELAEQKELGRRLPAEWFLQDIRD